MRRIVLGIALALAVSLVGGVAFGGVAAQEDDESDEADEDVPFGANVSAFMQANAAEAEGEVSDGMFAAAIQRTDDPEERGAIVAERMDELDQRGERLTADRGAIAPGNDTTVRDRAIAARVTVGAVGLERSIDQTGPVAEEVGVDTERLEELRTNVRELSGPEVAAIATDMARPSEVDQDRRQVETGPDDDRGANDGEGQGANGNQGADDGAADASNDGADDE